MAGGVRRIVALIGVLALAVSACGGPTTTKQAGQNETAVSEVRIAGEDDEWPAQGQGAKSTTFAYPMNVNVYEPLIKLGSDYSLQPGLAESWELIEPNTFRFHLRRGVKWHDGSDFDADDVVWTWGKRQLEGESLGTLARTLGPESVKKVDDFTVDIAPEQPNKRVFQQIVHPSGSIVPEGQHMDSDPPIGTGPFRVAEYQPNQQVVVERFDDYWGDKPKIERMTIRFLPEPQTRVDALRSGQVDFMMDLEPNAVSALEAEGFRVVESPPGRIMTIFVNKSGKPPHDLGANPTIRQAIALSIDRRSFVDVVYDGNATTSNWMTPAALLGDYADDVAPVPYNPDQARALLEREGWTEGPDGIRTKDGRRLELTIIGWPEVGRSAFQFIQAQLADIGIALTIQQAADFSTWRTYWQDKQFDLDVRIGNQNDANPAFIPILIFSTQFSGTETHAPGTDTYEAVVKEALAAKTTEQLQSKAAELMNILINQEYIVMPLAGVFRIYAMTEEFDLLDPHGARTSQDWTTLVPTGS